MKKVFMILITIGVVMLFGTAGASDVGNITVGRACMQGLASIGFLFSGMLGVLLCRLEEIRLRRTRRSQELRRCTSMAKNKRLYRKIKKTIWISKICLILISIFIFFHGNSLNL